MSTERKEMALLVERHIDRVSAAIERDKEALIFGDAAASELTPDIRTWCMKCDEHPMTCRCPQWPPDMLKEPSLKAADAILALVNASPRTPTREAIAKVVAENMPAVTINRHPTEEQMKREDAAYLRGCREAEEKAKIIDALRTREQAIQDMREVTGIHDLEGWKAQ